MTRFDLDLLNGLIGGVAVSALAWLVPRYARQILAAALVLAAATYLPFSLAAANRPLWLLIELAGACAFGALAVAGVRRSGWWLVTAWALHPVWDVALHYAGPGRAFAPESYTIACLTWDWTVAGLMIGWWFLRRASLRTA